MDAKQDQTEIESEEDQETAAQPDTSWAGIFRNLNILVTDWTDKLWHRARNLTETNFELARELADRGAVGDAILRLKFVVMKNPSHYRAWYLLGCCYMAKGEKAKASEAFAKTLALKSDHEEARCMLAVADPQALPRNQWPPSFPVSLIIQRFTLLAADYDEMRVAEDYQGPRLVYSALEQVPDIGGKERIDILDLGCGTGLAAPLFHPYASRLVGLDVTHAMLDIAGLRTDDEGHELYSEYVEKDLRHYLLSQQEPSFDLIIAIDTLNYVGGLTPVFDGIAKSLRPGGIFVMTTDPLPQGEKNYHLIPERSRFGHSEEYLQAQAARTHLNVLMMQRAEIATGQSCLLAAFQRS